MNWLMSANGKMYDHSSSFAHYGSIDWRQGNTKYNVGDIVYIYCTSPIKKVKYKCSVTEINKDSSTIRNDWKYWIDKNEYEKALSGKFLNLQLIEEVDSDKLSLDILKEQGLKAAPQGPMRLNEQLETFIAQVFETANDEDFPETLDLTVKLFEGVKKRVSVNKYERNPTARAKCIEFYGCTCKVCSFDFEDVYGSLGKGFIHVHHLIPIHEIGENYQINYVEHLIPVCPNCHAMLHRKVDGRYLTVEELAQLMNTN